MPTSLSTTYFSTRPTKQPSRLSPSPTVNHLESSQIESSAEREQRTRRHDAIVVYGVLYFFTVFAGHLFCGVSEKSRSS